MLYITRKKGESIIINNTIEVTIVEVKGNKVKIGCSFPENATILRKELHHKITTHNQSAAYDEIEFDQLENIKVFSK